MKSSTRFAALALALATASATAARAQSTFPDVPDDHWAAQAVRRLAQAGIIQGYPAKPKADAPVAASTKNPAPRVAKAHAKPLAKASAKSPAKPEARNVAKVARTKLTRRN